MLSLETPKLIGYGVALAAVLVLVFIVNGWRRDSAELPLVEADRAELTEALERSHANYLEVQELSHDYQQELVDLENAYSLQPLPAVRLCRTLPAKAGPVSAPESRHPEAAPAAGQLPEAAAGNPAEGADIGPELDAEAQRADAIVAQARALEAYALACSAAR